MTRHLPHARRRPHVPARPSFRCCVCGAPWPCSPARLNLLHAYRKDRIGLRIYLAAQLTRALQDRPDLDPGHLAARIVYWVPRTPPRRP
ncbi:flavin reductase [Plantactinospora sp. CA-290183]|uniref:flavin reductase n=1 Tax=Plantactinospora sp. CA-290183 TaxID=3240006 RepID=UPI003D89FD60